MNERIQSEKGQSLVLVTLLLFAFFAILALVLDGGFAYFQRRNAQNAADAGALAGARVFCEDPDANYGAAIQAASDYVASNEADLLPGYPQINTATNKVTVQTTITHDTFIARLLGQDQMTENALAQAGCYQPCLGEGVLPVVWICKPGAPSPSGEKTCEELPIDQATLDKYQKQPEASGCQPQTSVKGKKFVGWVCPELTIVMDNLDIDYLQCSSQGGPINCDFNGDLKDDYISASNRGWADLDGNDKNPAYSCPPGSEGAQELTDWILNGFTCPFYIHTWVGDQSGNAGDIYHTVEERRLTNPIVLLPVFDASCPEDPTGGAGGCVWHDPPHPPGDEVHYFTSATGNTNYYHIIRFAAFYITCVQENQHNDPCPGAMAFYHNNELYFKGGGYDDPIKGNKFEAIEGYFLKGYVPGIKGNCGSDIDTGVFTIYLDK